MFLGCNSSGNRAEQIVPGDISLPSREQSLSHQHDRLVPYVPDVLENNKRNDENSRNVNLNSENQIVPGYGRHFNLPLTDDRIVPSYAPILSAARRHVSDRETEKLFVEECISTVNNRIVVTDELARMKKPVSLKTKLLILALLLFILSVIIIIIIVVCMRARA